MAELDNLVDEDTCFWLDIAKKHDFAYENFNLCANCDGSEERAREIGCPNYQKV